MTTPDIADLCERLRAALEGVTPGPWTARRMHTGGFDVFDPRNRDVVTVYGGGVETESREANAAFIALSREAVPALLDTLERQAAEIERLRGALRFYADEYEDPNDGPWGVNSYDFGEVARAALTGEDHD